MNILIINHYAGSPDMGMEFRPYYFAKEWIKMGHCVKILAGDFSHLRMHNPTIKKDFEKQMIDEIEYIWIRTGNYKGNGTRRAFTMFRFVSKLWINAKKIAEDWNADVVIASSTYPLDTYAAQKIARKTGAKLIHEVHDMWPATLYEIGGMSKKHPFVILMQIAENSAYIHSDKIVSLLPLAKNYMQEHGMQADKFAYIPNGVMKEEWNSECSVPNGHTKFLENLHSNSKFIVGYFGGHALSNALDILLDAAKNITDRDVVFVLVGKGTEKERLNKRKKEEHIDNVFFLPPVDKKAIPDLLTYFDCIYVGSQDSPIYRFGICLNKIYDAMMSGKTIVCAISTPESPISQAKCGIMVSPSDVNSIGTAISQIKALTPEERRRMGELGKIEVEKKYNYRRLASEFLNIFKEKSDETGTSKEN